LAHFRIPSAFPKHQTLTFAPPVPPLGITADKKKIIIQIINLFS